MFNKEELEELLVRIGSKPKRSIKIFMIGGCALSFKGLKLATKDIDIIVSNKEDFNVFDKAMNENRFKSLADRESEFYATALAVYTKGESRIDVFLRRVGKMLMLSDSMIKRAQKYKKYSNLNVYLAANEDIFLFKAMTSREGDIFDCDRIMKEGLDYDIIYDEIVLQSREKNKWFFWFYESVCRLENYNGIVISIKKKILSLVKKHWKDRPFDFMDGIDNMDKHIADKKLLTELGRK